MYMIALSLGVLSALTISRFAIAQQNGNCDEDQWSCKSGQCIDSDQQCDGEVNCNDSSDETAAACLYIRCPPYAFRCSYGACVNGDARCNKVKDCADGSDELPILCTQTSTRFDDSESFFCDSGDVISIDEACDGKKNCPDGSDETLALCGNNQCPPYSFRCAYGACVDGSDECNGIVDCADGSDELPQKCGSKPGFGTRPPPTRPVQPKDGCVVPNVPNLIVSPPFDGTLKVPSGDVIERFGTVLYSCKAGYALFGGKTNFCSVEGWNDPHPQCLRYCSSKAVQGITFSARCEERDTFTEIRCDSTLRAGVRARISCAPGYVRPAGVRFQEVIVCGDDGSWDYPPVRCVPECGREYDPGHKFIVGGSTINNTLVPWNVGIYKLDRNSYTHICGGSIINAKIVVSAAHCFWDTQIDERAADISIYAVAAGKYYRDYYAKEPLSTQFFNVSEISMPRGYRDIHLNFNDDIAVLVLNKFISFREHIRPVCVHWNLNSRHNEEVPTEIGRVAGWGAIGASGALSLELKFLEIPAITFEQCERELAPQLKRMLTGDKFCAGGEPGQTVCSGDSGGGFTIPIVTNGHRVYYLWGVVSSGLTDRSDCVGTFYTAFTNVQHHIAMLLDYETKYRPK